MSEQEIKKWNAKIEKLKNYININFPDGCKPAMPLMCSRCVLGSEHKGSKWNPLCEQLNELT